MQRNKTKYTLKKATEHLFYETQMFYETLALLTQHQSQIGINLLLDSFAIHTRNLFDFFYPKRKPKPDDMLFCDYVSKPNYFRHNKTKKKYLRFIIRKVDKQVAHLTYARNRYNLKTKSWDFIDIGKKMTKTLVAFYDSLPCSYKNWHYFQEFKKVVDASKTT